MRPEAPVESVEVRAYRVPDIAAFRALLDAGAVDVLQADAARCVVSSGRGAGAPAGKVSVAGVERRAPPLELPGGRRS